MKISYTWIKEYIDLKGSPEELAEILTNSGSEVKIIEKIGDDYTMELEITPNRSDCLSYIGIARELSALTGKKIKIPSLKIKGQAQGEVPFKVDIIAKDLCPRYTARLIKDVKVRESPDWLKKKILSMGLRPVNNIVDITNYVLFELGQPLHAFDYDKIKGKTIVIRRAREGEKITSIDKEERLLTKDMLVIADEERPIAVAGVMGGLNTEVTEKTKNVLIESAYFDPISTRRTSFSLALISESSYRFERGVDPEMVFRTSDRAASLMADICSGEIAEFVDKGKKPQKERIVLLRIERLNKILNLNLKEEYVKKILSRLYLKVASSKKGIIKVSIPSFRPDIKYEIDLIEEVSRIYGFENIVMTIPGIIPNPERKSISWMAKEKTKDVLTSLGFNEVLTYAMISRGNIQKVFGPDISETINVRNYLSADQEAMRPSLIPGILNALIYNINRGIKDMKIFEVGKVYHKNSDTGYSERTNSCIALTGLFSSDWQRPKSSVTFFDLKGVLRKVFENLGLKDFAMVEKQYPFFENGASLNILYEEEYVGKTGCLARDVQNALDLRQDIFLAEIDFDSLLPYVNLEKRFSDIPKYPSIIRDISLIAGEDISFDRIAAIVEKQGRGFVERIEPLEKPYEGAQVPSGRKGLSFRIEYRDKYKTLTAEEVDRIHFAIRESLIEKLGVTLR